METEKKDQGSGSSPEMEFIRKMQADYMGLIEYIVTKMTERPVLGEGAIRLENIGNSTNEIKDNGKNDTHIGSPVSDPKEPLVREDNPRYAENLVEDMVDRVLANKGYIPGNRYNPDEKDHGLEDRLGNKNSVSEDDNGPYRGYQHDKMVENSSRSGDQRASIDRIIDPGHEYNPGNPDNGYERGKTRGSTDIETEITDNAEKTEDYIRNSVGDGSERGEDPDTDKDYTIDENNRNSRDNGRQSSDGRDGSSGRDGGPGADGKPGKNGSSGADGKPGKDGSSGRDGISGADGRDGGPGADGSQGADGISGADGKPGKDGSSGRDGRDGADGISGADGKPGKDGGPGADGSSGRDGSNNENNKQNPDIDKGSSSPAPEADSPLYKKGIDEFYKAHEKSGRLAEGLLKLFRDAYSIYQSFFETEDGRGIDLEKAKDEGLREKAKEAMYQHVLKFSSIPYKNVPKDIFVESDAVAGAVGFDRFTLNQIIDSQEDGLTFDNYMKHIKEESKSKMQRLQAVPLTLLDKSYSGKVAKHIGLEEKIEPSKLGINDMAYLLLSYKENGAIPEKAIEDKPYYKKAA